MAANGLTPPASGLRARILSSIKLSSLQFLSSIALRLISTIVLTRLLAPEIYGVFAIVLVYRYLLEMFSDLGIRSLILTREGEVEEVFVNTCWTVSILRGVLIAVASGLIALVIGTLQASGSFAADNAYANPVVPWAILALGGTGLLQGFQSMAPFLQERKMAFSRVTVTMIGSNIIGLIATIGLAFLTRSVWALVIGAYVQVSVLVLLSYMLFPGSAMRPSMDRHALGLIIDRGKWIMSHSILTALSESADRLMLGIVMTASTFGHYFIARQIIDIVTTFLRAMHAQMGLQVFTHILQADGETFRKNYYRYRLIFDGLAGLAAGGLLVLAPLAVDLVFDDRYQSAAPIVQILVFGLLLTGPLTLREAYSAERKFKAMTLLSIVSAATLWAGLWVTAIVLQNTVAALWIVALHRLPEALLLGIRGYREGRVTLVKEPLFLVAFATGAGCGWIVLTMWEALGP